MGKEVEVVDYDYRDRLATITVPDGGGGVRTALGGLLRRWAGCFNLLFAGNSVDFHLIGHVGGDGVGVVRIGVAVVERVLLLIAGPWVEAMMSSERERPMSWHRHWQQLRRAKQSRVYCTTS